MRKHLRAVAAAAALLTTATAARADDPFWLYLGVFFGFWV